MRALWRLEAALTLAITAGACSSASKSTSGNSDDGLSPQQIAQRAGSLFASASSFHMRGTFPFGDWSEVQLDGHFGRSVGYGTVKAQGWTLRVIDGACSRLHAGV
jgi:hypothetical protein